MKSFWKTQVHAKLMLTPNKLQFAKSTLATFRHEDLKFRRVLIAGSLKVLPASCFHLAAHLPFARPRCVW